MVGRTIRRFREAKGLTQEQLAERLCVTRQAVSNWENEKTQPDIDTLHKIAQVLEVSVEELIYGEKRERENKTIVNHNVTKNIRAFLRRGSGDGHFLRELGLGRLGDFPRAAQLVLCAVLCHPLRVVVTVLRGRSGDSTAQDASAVVCGGFVRPRKSGGRMASPCG